MSNTALKIPDFDQMISMAETIKELKYKKLKLEVEIKDASAKIIKACRTNSDYFEAGKPASMSYIENTFAYTGFNDELIPKRMELAQITSDLDRCQVLMDVYKAMIDVFRTVSANERRSVS